MACGTMPTIAARGAVLPATASSWRVAAAAAARRAPRVAPAAAARGRRPRIDREWTIAASKEDDAKTSGDGDGDGNAFDSADDWIANWKAGNFPRAKGWKYGDPSTAGTGTFSEEVGAASASARASSDDADDDASSDDAASSQETSSSREDAYGGDPNAYAYVFCHNLMSAPDDSFACMYLRDVLRAVDVDLVAPDLTVMDDEDGGTAGAADFTVSTAVARLAVAVSAAANATSPPRKVRLIGSSLGAYVAALYASYPENAGVVDRVMLLAPTFKPVDCVDGLEKARSPYTGSHTTASAW